MKFSVKIPILLCLFGINCHANGNFKAKYKWNQLDFEFETSQERNESIKNGSFIPENITPMGIDVSDNRVFLSLPRLKTGVPASLVYVQMNDLNESSSPNLKPYPNWQSHRPGNNTNIPDVISPVQIKIDNCKRLWAIDSGIVGVLDQSKPTRLAPTRLLIFNLQNNTLIRHFDLPNLNSDNFEFLNLAIDSNICENAYAYIADSRLKPSLTIYSLKTNETWIVTHHFFNMEPMAGEFMNAGMQYPLSVGLYGLALSETKSNGFANLYFHSLSSYLEFVVSTNVLQDKNASLSQSQFYKSFQLIGKREQNQQAGLSVYDSKKKVIFYTIPNLSGVACWNTNAKIDDTTIQNITNIYTDANKMYPMDVKIDEKGQLWFLSNRLDKFFDRKLNKSETNFIIYSIPVEEAIKDTPCDRAENGSNDSNAKQPAVLLVLFGSLIMWAFSKF